MKLYDLALHAGEITRELVEDIKRLEPFGQNNEKPAVAVLGGDVLSSRFVGKNEQPHLKLVIGQNARKIDAVAFYYKDAHALIPGRADFLCEPGIDSMTNRPQLIVRDIVYYQDDALIRSFLNANAESFAKGFLDEVSALGASEFGMPDEASFTEALQEALAQSRFGLCVSVQTAPALRRVLGLASVREAMKQGRLILWDHKSFSPDNCIACGMAAGHTRVLCVGANPNTYLFDDEMRTAYHNHAASVFLNRDKLLGVYRALGAMLKRPRTVADIARKLSLSLESAAFAMRVLSELKLLTIDKSDRILALNEGQPRRELRQSRCYSNFEDLLNG